VLQEIVQAEKKSWVINAFDSYRQTEINSKRVTAKTEQEGLCYITQVLPTVDSI